MISLSDPRGVDPTEERDAATEVHPVIALFVTALTENSPAAWDKLLQTLSQLSNADTSELSSNSQLQHYLHRAVQKARASPTEHATTQLNALEGMAAAFPDLVKEYSTQPLQHSYSYSSIERTRVCKNKTRKEKGAGKKPTSRSLGAGDEIFQYSPEQLPATYRMPQVQVMELEGAARQVSHEMITTQQQSVNFPLQFRSPESPPFKHPFFRPSQVSRGARGRQKLQRVMLQPVMASEMEEGRDKDVSSDLKTSSLSQKCYQKVKFLIPSTKENLKTAFDVIEAFASGMLGSESVYLNLSNCSPWNPYSLVVVPQSRAKPEHYIMSKFGILHVYPNRTVDLHGYAEWTREASLFAVLKQIPFFRTFLPQKAFRCWHSNVKCLQFARFCSILSKSCLQFFPDFSSGLVKIQGLCTELLDSPYHHLNPTTEYSLEDYQHSQEASQAKATRLLQRFFKYCKRLAMDITTNTRSQVMELETEKRHQPFVSELPLSIQKAKHARLERRLELMNQRAARLADFSMLVDRMVASSLLRWARHNTQEWVELALLRPPPSSLSSPLTTPLHADKGEGAERGDGVEEVGEGVKQDDRCNRRALLRVELSMCEFAGTISLSTNPSPEEVEETLLQSLHSVTGVISETVQPSVYTTPIPSAYPSTPRATRGRESILTSFALPPPLPPPPSLPLQPVPPIGGTPNRSTPLGPPPSFPSQQQQQQRKFEEGGGGGGVATPSGRSRGLSRSILGCAATMSHTTMTGLLGGQEANNRLRAELVPSPLEKEHFTKWMRCDTVLSDCVDRATAALARTMEELSAISRQHEWICEVHSFVLEWRRGGGRVGQPSAELLEEMLIRIDGWLKSLADLPSTFHTSQGLVRVEGGVLKGSLLAQLKGVLHQMQNLGVSFGRKVLTATLEQTRAHTETLLSKPEDLISFAVYANHVKSCRAFHEREQSRVQHTLRISHVLATHGVEVSVGDRHMGRELRSSWMAFEKQLRAAAYFMEEQTPAQTSELHRRIAECEEEMEGLVGEVNQGRFVDPSSKPVAILQALQEYQEKLFALRSNLLELSRCKEAILGHPYDLGSVSSVMEHFFARQEVWKFKKGFDQQEDDWMGKAFKKLDFTFISDKISSWLDACDRLERVLAGVKDKVLKKWKERLLVYKGVIPLFIELSSKALKTAHWHNIFALLDEDYFPNYHYTLRELWDCELSRHEEVLLEICHTAKKEENLLTLMQRIQQEWEGRKLVIVQTPAKGYQFCLPVETARETTSSGRGGRKRVTISTVEPSAIENEFLYHVSNESEIVLALEESSVQLRLMLGTSGLAKGLQGQIESLVVTCRQLEEVFSLLMQCQHLWQDLLVFFSAMSPGVREGECGEEVERLQQATGRLREVMRSVQDDPLALSLLGKRRGQKGFKELQGDTLRLNLRGTLALLKNVFEQLSSRIEEQSCQFPRLFFLSPRDSLALLSHRGNPLSISSLITRIFPSISALSVAECIAHNKKDQTVEEGFQIVSVEGALGEQLLLTVPLLLTDSKSRVEWLQALEGALRSSLSRRLTECLVSLPDALLMQQAGGAASASATCRPLGSVPTQPSPLVDTVDRHTRLKSEEEKELWAWLQLHPSQVVELAFQIRWSSSIQGALSATYPQAALQDLHGRLCSTHDGLAHYLRTLLLCERRGGEGEGEGEGGGNRLEQSTPQQQHQEQLVLYASYKDKVILSIKNLLLLTKHKMDFVSRILSDWLSFKPDSFASTVGHICYFTDDGDQSVRNDIINSTVAKAMHLTPTTPLPLPLPLPHPLSLSSSHQLHPIQSVHSLAMTSSHSLVSSIHSLHAAGYVTIPTKPGSLSLLHMDPIALATTSSSSRSSFDPTFGHANMTGCVVQMGLGPASPSSVTRYGFEYHGCSSRLVLTPVTEAGLVSLASALASYDVGAVSGSAGSGKMETTVELAKVLGRHSYVYRCFQHTSAQLLQRLLMASLGAGSILVLGNTHALDPLVLVQLGKQLQSIHSDLSKALQDTRSGMPQPVSGRQIASRIDWYEDHSSLGFDDKCSLDVAGRSISASSMFGCVMLSRESLLDNSTNAAICVPDSLKSVLRPVVVLCPDREVIAEALLLVSGFTNTHVLSRKLPTLLEHISSQLSFSGDRSSLFGFRELKTVLHEGCAYMTRERRKGSCDGGGGGGGGGGGEGQGELGWEGERGRKGGTGGQLWRMEVEAVAHGLKVMCDRRCCGLRGGGGDCVGDLGADVKVIVRECLNLLVTESCTEEREGEGEGEGKREGVGEEEEEEVEGDVVKSANGECDGDGDKVLLNVIRSELEERHLQRIPSLVNKVHQLHTALLEHRCVVLAGSCCSGRTTCYKTLIAAYQRISERRLSYDYSPQVNCTVINCGAYSIEELFGRYQKATGANNMLWENGILTQLFLQVQRAEQLAVVASARGGVGGGGGGGRVRHWVVLDGPMEPALMECLAVMCSGLTRFSLANGEELKLPGSCQLLLEPDQLSHLSPALLSSPSCALVYFDPRVLRQESLMDTWLDLAPTRHNLSSVSVETLASMMRENVPQVLKFIANNRYDSDSAGTSSSVSQTSRSQDGNQSQDQNQDQNRPHKAHTNMSDAAGDCGSMTNQLQQDHTPHQTHPHQTHPHQEHQHSSSSLITTSTTSSTSTHAHALSTTNNCKLEVMCFLNFLSAIMERNAPKYDASSVKYGTLSYRSSHVSSHMSSRMSSRMSSARSSDSDERHNVVDTEDTKATVMFQQLTEEDFMAIDDDLVFDLHYATHMQMANMFSFAMVWAFGAFVPFSKLSAFDVFMREVVVKLPYEVSIPEAGSVFDYYLDLKQYQYLSWDERPAKEDVLDGYVALPELDRFAYIIDLYLSYNSNVMIVGEPGCGKTTFVEYLISSRMPTKRIPVTPTLTSHQLRSTVVEKVQQIERRNVQKEKLSSSQRFVFFLDDLHLASSAGPGGCGHRAGSKEVLVLETVRYAVACKSLADTSRHFQHELHSTQFVACATPSKLTGFSPRLLRLFNPVPFIPVSDKALHAILKQSVDKWAKSFPSLGDPGLFTEAVAASIVTIFRSVTGRLRPTLSPSHPYQLFNMHSLLRVCEGMLLLAHQPGAQLQPALSLVNRRGFTSSKKTSSTRKQQPHPHPKAGGISRLTGSVGHPSGGGEIPTSMSNIMLTRRKSNVGVKASLNKDPEAMLTLRNLVRLLCHECSRVFADRIVGSKERIWFSKLLEASVQHCFCGADASPPSSVTSLQASVSAAHNLRGTRRMPGARHARAVGFHQSMTGVGGGGGSREELLKVGVRVDIARALLERRDLETDEVLPPPTLVEALDRVMVRGEDLTGLIFAWLPSPAEEGGNGEGGEGEEGDGEWEGSEATGNGYEQESVGTVGSESQDQDEAPEEKCDYREVGDGQVMDCLQKHLGQYRASRLEEGLPTDELILFKATLEHCTRLLRVMNLPGSHSILLGPKGSGRRSLVRLASHIMGAQMFEVVVSPQTSSKHFKSQLKQVCLSAGLDSRRTSLIVVAASHASSSQWEDICQLMSEGLCMGLFSSSELLVMGNKLQKGKLKKTAERAHQAFGLSVLKSLHVFVIWDTNHTTNSPFVPLANEPVKEGENSSYGDSERTVFSSLCRACSYIDHYRPWSKEAFSDIALHKWREGGGLLQADSTQMEAISLLAAHCHMSTSLLLQQTLPHLAPELVSPKTFMECLRVTQNMASVLASREEDSILRLEMALGKLEGVEQAVLQLEGELVCLRPQHKAAEGKVKEMMRQITASKDRYKAANARCKGAQETITLESEKVENLQKAYDAKFSEVRPVYSSALEAFSSVSKGDVLEVAGYNSPPDMLAPVFTSLCMLFDRPPTWDECRRLLLGHNFFEHLTFFDRDNLPRHKLQRLRHTVAKTLGFSGLSQGSKGIRSLSRWLNALVDYHKSKSIIDPIEKQLKTAEKIKMEAQGTYIDMRKDMVRTKQVLEEALGAHRDSVREVKDIESHIKTIESRLGKGKLLLDAMSTQETRWKERLHAAQERLDYAASHAFLCAASVCYLPRVPPDRHQQLWDSWVLYCQGKVAMGSVLPPSDSRLVSRENKPGTEPLVHQNLVRVREDFSLQKALSERKERMFWEQESSFLERTTFERELLARACLAHGATQWPLVVDPHHRFRSLAHAMYCIETKESVNSPPANKTNLTNGLLDHNVTTNLKFLQTGEEDFPQKFEEAVTTGGVTVVCIDDRGGSESGERRMMSELLKVLLESRAQIIPGEETDLEVDYDVVTVHPSFMLYLVCQQELPLPARLSIDLADFCVVDLSYSALGLQRHLQQYVISRDRPEFCIQHKSLQTDLAMHQEEIDQSQENILAAVLGESQPLMDSSSVMEVLRECETTQASALEQLRETTRVRKVFEQQRAGYWPLAKHAAVLFTISQSLCKHLWYLAFSLQDYEAIIDGLLAKSSSRKLLGASKSAMSGNMLHLQRQLSLCVYRTLQPNLFWSHQLLFLFLVSVELLKRKGSLSTQEQGLLATNLSPPDAQLDTLLANTEKPLDWISIEAWCGARFLQKHLQLFAKLTHSLLNHSKEWKEYFQLKPSLLVPLPSLGIPLLSGAKLLLWKVLCPKQFIEASKELAMLSLGDDFVTHSCNITSILQRSQPRMPIMCLLSERHPLNTQPLKTLLEKSSVTVGAKVVVYSVTHSQEMEHLLPQVLANLSKHQGGEAKALWVVIEHFYLSSQWSKLLTKLVQTISSQPLDDFHPASRLWVPLPLPVLLQDPRQLALTNCLKIAVEEEGACTSLGHRHSTQSTNSNMFVEDLEKVLAASDIVSTRKPSSWEVYEYLLSKLMHFLPNVLPVEELCGLKPTEKAVGRSLQNFLFEELCTTNACVKQLNRMLQHLLQSLRRESIDLFSPTVKQWLHCVSQNRVPKEWDFLSRTHALNYPSSNNVTLTELISVLRNRLQFQMHHLQQGTVPRRRVLDASLFCNVQWLLVLMRQVYSERHRVNLEDVELRCKVLDLGQVDKEGEDELAVMFSDHQLKGKRLLCGVRVQGLEEATESHSPVELVVTANRKRFDAQPSELRD